MEGWRAKGVEEGTSREGEGAGDVKALKPFMESELLFAGVDVVMCERTIYVVHPRGLFRAMKVER
jgi:hypothetical protein